MLSLQKCSESIDTGNDKNEYPSYGKIPAGVPLQVTGETNGLPSVVIQALQGGIGWISGNYVAPHTG